MPSDRIHKGLKGIPSEYFPIWDETLAYERGLPHFRQLPEFSEEGVLTPAPGAGEYTYQPLKLMTLPMSARRQLSPSPTRQVEGGDDSSAPMAVPLFRNSHEIDSTLSWASTPSNSSVWCQPPGEGSSQDMYIHSNLPQPHDAVYEDWYINFVHENPAEQLVLEEQTYFQTDFLPSMDTASDPTSAPRHLQWNIPHDRSKISPQSDVPMTDMSWLGPL